MAVRHRPNEELRWLKRRTRYLVIGERNPNDVIVYPDSGKVMVRPARAIFRQAATMEYWEGEG